MAKIIGNTTATPNPQPNWTQSDSTKADYIKNKPTVLSEDEIIGLIEEHGPDAQIQSDWNQTDTTEVDFIKNKPTLGALSEKDEVAKTDLASALKTEIESKLDGDAVDQKINDAFNDFAAELSDDKTVNTYKELIDYAATHGAEFTALVGEVDANTKAITEKVDKITGKGLSTNDFTDAYKTKLDSAFDADDIKAGVTSTTTLTAGSSATATAAWDEANKKINFTFGIPKGDTGATGNGIKSINLTSSNGLVDTYTITFTDGSTTTFVVTNGEKGEAGKDGVDGNDGADGKDGRGISSIVKTSSSGLVDTYTITFTDNTQTTFTVTNGAKGADGANGEDGEDGTDGVSITKAEINTNGELVLTFSNGNTTNVGKVVGADGINGTNGTNGADGQDGKDGVSVTHSWNGTVLTVTSASGTSSANLKGADGQDYVLTNDDKQEIADLAVTGLAKVATSGSYNDLIDKPIIPEGTSAIAESVKTTDGDTLRFFVGTQDEYKALESKDGLFALIEDDPNIENLNALADAVSEHEAMLVDIEDELGNWLAYTLNSDGNSYACSGYGNSSSQHIVIPTTYRGLPVTKIRQNAFSGCLDIKSVTISEGIESIEAFAFGSCTNLIEITIPKSLTSIGQSAFYNCSGLTRVIIPESVTDIANYAFNLCDSLTIYCEVASQPSTWNSSWNSSSCPVVWGTGSLETYGAVHALTADKATTAESADSLVLTTGTVTSTYNGTNGYYISSLVKKRFITLFFKADGACDTVVLYRPDDTCASYSTKSGRGYYCKYNVDSPYASLITFHKEDGTIITPGYINYRIL